MIGIYKITSPSGKVYIGQSIDIEDRWFQHRTWCHIGKLKNSFKKHGVSNHKFEILEECSVDQLNERERHFQDFYDVLGPNGLNLVLQKTDEKKMVHSEETKEKLRVHNTGKVPSKESKEKNRLASTGYRHTEEAKEKNRQAILGRKQSEEHRMNNGKAHSKRVINTVTGEVFDSIKLAADSIEMKHIQLWDRLSGIVKNKTNFILLKDYKENK